MNHYIPTGPSDPYYGVASHPVYVTDRASVLGYLGGKRNQIYGPGYERINMSVFKNFTVYREEKLQVRADIFNLFNTPSLGEPNDNTIDSNGGQITTHRTFQNNTPDSRFFQLSMKYSF